MVVAFVCQYRHVRAAASAHALVVALASTLGAGCAATTTNSSTSSSATATMSAGRRGPAHDQVRNDGATVPVSSQKVADAERELAEEVTLRRILLVALSRNPELTEARERVRAQRELAPAASRLPDPELEYQLWAAPLDRPYALGEAEMHMFGLRQSFPAPGTLGARSDALAAQADVAAQSQRTREQDLAARVRRAYAEYYRADREYRIHLEHVGLAQQVLDMTRAAYQGGRGRQQDVLRAVVAMSRLHNDVAKIDADRRTAQALLNTLMARPMNAALGPPAPIEASQTQVHVDGLMKEVEHRPEIAAAQSAIRARQSEADAARAAGKWPRFMLGVQYMYMPMVEQPHNYGVMFSMSLPWLSSRYGEEVRAAEAQVAAERGALSSARNAARYELFEATQRLKAARESLVIFERDLGPQAQQSFESAQAAYRGGQSDSLALFDALSSLLDVRLERERALVNVETALADVERALGGPLPGANTQEGR